MTDEELRIEATYTVEWESTPMIDRPLFVHAYITGAAPREKRISELKKENARLKKEFEETQDIATIAYMQGVCKNMAELEKAKEIIKELLSLPYANDFEVYAPVSNYLSRAEAFLKECEK